MEFIYENFVDDGNFGIVYRPQGVSITTVEKYIDEALKNIVIEDDKVSLNGKEMIDDYVKSGVYNGDGTATLTIGDNGKTAEITDLPKPMGEKEVDELLNNE